MVNYDYVHLHKLTSKIQLSREGDQGALILMALSNDL